MEDTGPENLVVEGAWVENVDVVMAWAEEGAEDTDPTVAWLGRGGVEDATHKTPKGWRCRWQRSSTQIANGGSSFVHLECKGIDHDCDTICFDLICQWCTQWTAIDVVGRLHQN